MSICICIPSDHWALALGKKEGDVNIYICIPVDHWALALGGEVE